MKITHEQIEICERHDWTVHIEDGDIWIESWSPAGENLVYEIYEDEGFVGSIKRLAADFDADEHAEMWVAGRGKNGVPSSIRELVDDADAIDKMLQDLASALADTEEE